MEASLLCNPYSAKGGSIGQFHGTETLMLFFLILVFKAGDILPVVVLEFLSLLVFFVVFVSVFLVFVLVFMFVRV